MHPVKEILVFISLVNDGCYLHQFNFRTKKFLNSFEIPKLKRLGENDKIYLQTVPSDNVIFWRIHCYIWGEMKKPVNREFVYNRLIVNKLDDKRIMRDLPDQMSNYAKFYPLDKDNVLVEAYNCQLFEYKSASSIIPAKRTFYHWSLLDQKIVNES